MRNDWQRQPWRPGRIYRSRTNRMIAGVSGGLSEATGIDVSLVRLGWLLSMFVGGFVIYLILALVIPERPAGAEVVDASLRQNWHEMSQRFGIVIGLVVILVGVLFLADAAGWLPIRLGEVWRLFWRIFWPLVLVGLGGLVLVSAFWGDRDWWRRLRLPQRGTRLHRSTTDRVFAGVCSGLAEYLGIDATLVRLIWAIGSLSSVGLGILAYVVAALVLPPE